MLGAFASANNAPISFYNVYKIYKEKHRPQRANTQRLARGYVAKKPVKCRQETRKILGPQRVQNVVKKPPRRRGLNSSKCRQEIRNGARPQRVQMSPTNPQTFGTYTGRKRSINPAPLSHITTYTKTGPQRRGLSCSIRVVAVRRVPVPRWGPQVWPPRSVSNYTRFPLWRWCTFGT